MEKSKTQSGTAATIELWLVRHGQTYANLNKVIQGHEGGELTELGQTQAVKIGERLQSEVFDKICVSDLNRTRFPNKENDGSLQYDSRLREKCGGVLQGAPLNAFKNEAKAHRTDIRQYRPKEGEAWQDVFDRAQSFLVELTNQHLAKVKREATVSKIKVLVVTHGGWIGEFNNVVKVLSGRQPTYTNNAKNCALYVYNIERNAKGGLKARCLIDNDNSHLTGGPVLQVPEERKVVEEVPRANKIAGKNFNSKTNGNKVFAAKNQRPQQVLYNNNKNGSSNPNKAGSSVQQKTFEFKI